MKRWPAGFSKSNETIGANHGLASRATPREGVRAMTAAGSRGNPWALSGVFFVAFFIAGLVLSGVLAPAPYPLPGTSSAEIVRYFTEGRTAVVTLGFLQGLSAVALFAFPAFVRRTVPGTRTLPGLTLGGGIPPFGRTSIVGAGPDGVGRGNCPRRHLALPDLPRRRPRPRCFARAVRGGGFDRRHENQGASRMDLVGRHRGGRDLALVPGLVDMLSGLDLHPARAGALLRLERCGERRAGSLTKDSVLAPRMSQ
jgi:hypothetical protein